MGGVGGEYSVFADDVFFVALRGAVANMYNLEYRQGKKSQYTYENVCIVPGGRAGLSRVAAVIGDVYCVSWPSSPSYARGRSDA